MARRLADEGAEVVSADLDVSACVGVPVTADLGTPAASPPSCGR